MGAAIHRNASSQPAQGPRPGTGSRYMPSNLAAQLRLIFRTQMFERNGEPDHFIQAFRLNSLRLRCLARGRRREPTLEVRTQVVPDLDLTGIAEAARNAPPHDPELRPDAFIGVCEDSC